MERKVKMDVSALLIVGIVFSSIGVCFLPVGIVSLFVGGSAVGDLYVFAFVFGGIGTLFLVLGILFLGMVLKKHNICKRLVREGYYIPAQVIEVDRNLNVSYGNTNRIGGGRHPYIIKCGYKDENDTLHVFSSRNINKYPGDDLIGRQVRVYVDRNDYNNFKYYYVDIDEVLGNVIEH